VLGFHQIVATAEAFGCQAQIETTSTPAVVNEHDHLAAGVVARCRQVTLDTRAYDGLWDIFDSAGLQLHVHRSANAEKQLNVLHHHRASTTCAGTATPPRRR
jgi:hypothetical protein